MNGAAVSFFIYTALLGALGLWSYKLVERIPISKYEEEFYAAGRGLGGFIVALIIAAGLSSAGTFIAGPGMTYKHGFSWMYFNNFNIFINLLLLASVGIGVGIVARRVGATTYLDLFKARYESRAVVVLLAALVTFFLIPYMAAQFVGAARVTVQMTGLSYFPSLALGASVVLIYCVLGGMRGNAIAAVVQGVIITLGCLLLFIGTVRVAGGFEKATQILAKQDINLLSPTSGGAFSPLFALSLASMMGFFIVGMPHALLGSLVYKNTKALKRGIWIGGILLLIWNVCLCLSGALGRAINPGLAIADEIGPWLAMHVLPPFLGGIILAGVVAGIQTTVAAMAIIITSSIAKNLVAEFRADFSPEKAKLVSRLTMTGCISLSIILALFQPALIQWIILFSVGGLESATFGSLLLGMFWKRGNKWGAMASICSGMLVYTLSNTAIPTLRIGDAHPTLISVLISTAVFVLVSLATQGPSVTVLRTFWGRPQMDKQQVSASVPGGQIGAGVAGRFAPRDINTETWLKIRE